MTSTRILLSGYFGFGNAGDEAILEAAVEAFKTRNISVAVLSKSPHETSQVLGMPAWDRNNLKQVLQGIRESDLIISGGGGLFQDITSFRSLAYYLRIPILAKFLGKKTMIFAQGIGPIQTFPGKAAMRIAGNWFFDRITVRDETSRNLLQSLGVKKKIEVTADLAFLFPLPSPMEQEVVRKRFRFDASKKLLGINLRKWRNVDWHLEAVAKGITKFCETYNVFPVLLPFQAEEDNAVLEWLHRSLKIPHQWISESLSPKELLAVIANFHFLVGMRFHALLFAAKSFVPWLGISYDAKVESLGKSLGLPVFSLEELTFKHFLAFLSRGWEQQEYWRKQLEFQLPTMMEKAEQNIRIALELLENPA